VTVLELPKLPHRKSQALNIAWQQYGRDAEIVVTLDADTVLPPNSLGDWTWQLTLHTDVGGLSSKFTAQGTGYLGRMQKAEYAAWADLCLMKGRTPVLSGTACALRGDILRDIADRPDREGPWSYASAVEDFEITCRIRDLGYRVKVSPTVRAYTDHMPTLRALWGQRMKWASGTIEDLFGMKMGKVAFGSWWSQMFGGFDVLLKMLFVTVITAAISFGMFRVSTLWIIGVSTVMITSVVRAHRIPHADWKDYMLAAAFVPYEVFSWIRAAWFVTAWVSVLKSKITNKKTDRWAAQYAAEKG
jgi:cellulose synthase/poly-beta-1,6-N-acetylglucosamine synthase-like glycosyltransferase